MKDNSIGEMPGPPFTRDVPYPTYLGEIDGTGYFGDIPGIPGSGFGEVPFPPSRFGAVPGIIFGDVNVPSFGEVNSPPAK